MLYLLNAFSLNMLAEPWATVRVAPLTVNSARAMYGEAVRSSVGHADTAAILSRMLGQSVAVNRCTVTLHVDDAAIVAQYTGPRLAEGTTTLPDGAAIRFFLVTVTSYGNA